MRLDLAGAAVLAALLGLPSRAALACPDCPAVRAARAAVLADPNAGLYVAYTVLPFVVLAAAVVAIERLDRTEKDRG